MRFASSPETNSPLLLRSLRAFHCIGLWLAVIMMPPSACCWMTAISVVGVVESPRSITSMPMLCNVLHTRRFTMSPEMRASRPTTMRILEQPAFRKSLSSNCEEAVCSTDAVAFCSSKKVAKAVVNLTTSTGVRFSPMVPPIVPRIPEMDLISVIN